METEKIRPDIYGLKEKIEADVAFGNRMIASAATATCDLNVNEILLIEKWIQDSVGKISDRTIE